MLPFSAGAHASLEGGFVLIQFPEETDPDVVYVEGIMGDLYLESVEEVKRYQSAFERNQAVALALGRKFGIPFGIGERTQLSGEKTIQALAHNSRARHRRSPS